MDLPVGDGVDVARERLAGSPVRLARGDPVNVVLERLDRRVVVLARPRDDLKIPLDGDGLDELAVAVDGVRRRLGVCRLRPGLVVEHDSRHLACEHGVGGVEHVAQVLLGAHAAPRVLVVVPVGNGRRPQVAAPVGARRPRPSRRRRLALQLHIGAHEHWHKLDRVAVDEVDFGVAEQVDFVIVEHGDLAVKVRIVRIGELHFAQDALLVCHVGRVRRRRRRRRGDPHAHRRLWLVAVAVAEGADGAELGVAVVVAVVVVARRHGDAEVQAPDAALRVGRVLRCAVGPPARKVGVVLAVEHRDDDVAAAHFPHKACFVGVGLAANPPEVLALCHERRLDRVKLGGGARDRELPSKRLATVARIPPVGARPDVVDDNEVVKVRRRKRRRRGRRRRRRRGWGLWRLRRCVGRAGSRRRGVHKLLHFQTARRGASRRLRFASHQCHTVGRKSGVAPRVAAGQVKCRGCGGVDQHIPRVLVVERAWALAPGVCVASMVAVAVRNRATLIAQRGTRRPVTGARLIGVQRGQARRRRRRRTDVDGVGVLALVAFRVGDAHPQAARRQVGEVVVAAPVRAGAGALRRVATREQRVGAHVAAAVGVGLCLQRRLERLVSLELRARRQVSAVGVLQRGQVGARRKPEGVPRGAAVRRVRRRRRRRRQDERGRRRRALVVTAVDGRLGHGVVEREPRLARRRPGPVVVEEPAAERALGGARGPALKPLPPKRPVDQPSDVVLLERPLHPADAVARRNGVLLARDTLAVFLVGQDRIGGLPVCIGLGHQKGEFAQQVLPLLLGAGAVAARKRRVAIGVPLARVPRVVVNPLLRLLRVVVQRPLGGEVKVATNVVAALEEFNVDGQALFRLFGGVQHNVHRNDGERGLEVILVKVGQLGPRLGLHRADPGLVLQQDAPRLDSERVLVGLQHVDKVLRRADRAARILGVVLGPVGLRQAPRGKVAAHIRRARRPRPPIDRLIVLEHEPLVRDVRNVLHIVGVHVVEFRLRGRTRAVVVGKLAAELVHVAVLVGAHLHRAEVANLVGGGGRRRRHRRGR